MYLFKTEKFSIKNIYIKYVYKIRDLCTVIINKNEYKNRYKNKYSYFALVSILIIFVIKHGFMSFSVFKYYWYKILNLIKIKFIKNNNESKDSSYVKESNQSKDSSHVKESNQSKDSSHVKESNENKNSHEKEKDK